MYRMIPIAKPLIGEEEKKKVMEVLDSGILAAGRVVTEFEEKFARYIGSKHAMATSSGTTALHLALQAAGIGWGDKVLTTPFTFIATANSILYCGGVPVFCDIDPETFNLDPDAASSVLEKVPGIKAILVVHLFGLSADMAALRKLAEKHHILLIEDAAQAHGAMFNGKYAGSLGDASIFSFYPTKNMTTAEGGMVLTDKDELARDVRLLRSHGAPNEYQHEILGYNFRMTNIEAALGVCQLEKLPGFNEKRRKNAAFYNERFKEIGWLKTPGEPSGYHHVYHQYTLRVPERARFIEHLTSAGVASKVYYPLPLHHQPLYKKLGYGELCYPEAEKAAGEVVSLPVHPALTEGDLEQVAGAVSAFKPKE